MEASSVRNVLPVDDWKTGCNNEKLTLKTNKNCSKISKQSQQHHIVEEVSETGEIYFHCTACRKTFRSRTQKYYHLQCWNQDEIHKCDICEKSFSRQSQLKYHRESHLSPINECSTCHKTFSNPLALKKHASLHKVQPKPCPHCDKTFLKKISLEQHVAAQHLHQLQYGCAKCNKKYASKSTLQQHLQSHEEKRFECSFCGKHFQRNSILKLHQKRHYQTSTYSCQICGKFFTETGALARHRKIHEESTLQYHCILCDKNILRKDNMNRHMATIHPDEKYEDIVQVMKPTPQNANNEQISKICEENQSESKNEKTEVGDYENNDTPNEIKFNGIRTTTETSNNIVIIEDRILQSSLIDTNKLQDGGTEYCKGYTDNISSYSPLVNKIQVIMAPAIKDAYSNKIVTSYDNPIGQVLLSNSTENNHVTEHQNDLQSLNSDEENKINNSLSLILNSKNVSDPLTTENIIHENFVSTSESLVQNNLSNTSKINVIPSNDFQNINRNKPSVIRSIGNVQKKLTTNNCDGLGTEAKISSHYEYKHKKYNRHYNVDLYRKILGCDDDDDYDNSDSVEQIGDFHSVGQQKQQDFICHNLQLDSSCDVNTTTVHWRKSFKKIYETSTS